MKKDVVISVRNVSKNFRLPHEKTDSIKSGVIGIFRKKDRSVEIQHALKDISFEVKRGEFFGILGRNGSGKSTLLKILAEIYRPSDGSVHISGKLVPFIELGVGFNPELTGRENVYLNGALLGFSKTEIDDRYNEIVEFAELEEFMDQKLKNYSSGMQVRLAFSVATRAEADILLVDEVLAVGDADFQRKCYDYFKSLKKCGKTVIFVTHDMGAVREYCDRAVLVDDGNITIDSSADIVADEYLKLFMQDSLGLTDGKKSDDRWGSRDIIFERVRHNFSQDKLKLDLYVKNNLEQEFNDTVDIGIDIYSEGVLVTGLNYMSSYQRALSFKPKEKKHIIVELPNVLTDYTYNISLNIKSDGNKNICDKWDNAITFRNPSKKGRFFKVVIEPKTFQESTGMRKHNE